MSGVYFHARGREPVRLAGAERHYANLLVADLSCAVLGTLGPLDAKRLEPALIDQRRARDPRLLSTLIRIGDPLLQVDGTPLHTWHLSLQTGVAVGNDALRLLTRVTAQCEIHGYVEGPNRAWLAGIIDAGRASCVLRRDMGWEAVAALLREADDAPVVMSYSVTDSFPSYGAACLAGFHHARGYDAWEELDDAQQWAFALGGIRSRAGLELRPQDWASYRFQELSAFELIERIGPLERRKQG